jgi:DNA-directed RNA polymerase specialized sigma subunit
MSAPPRHGIEAQAIRQMARDLREYEQARIGDVDRRVDRTVTRLTATLGRHPTAAETATVANLEVEDVLEAWLRRDA